MSWINKISFKYKLAIPIAIVALAFSGLIAQVFVVYNEQQQANRLLSEEVQPVMDNLEDAYRDMYQVMTAGMAMALTQPDDHASIELHRFNFYDNGPKAFPRLASVHELIDTGFLSESSRANVRKLEQEYDKWQKRYEFMVTNPERALSYYYANDAMAEKDFEAIRKLLKVVRKDIETQRAALVSEVQTHSEETNTILLAGSILSLLVSAFITLVVIRVIVNPLQQLTRALEDISAGDGDLSTRIPVLGSDEIGQLATAFNTFVSKIHTTLAKVVTASHHVRSDASQLSMLTAQVLNACHSQQAQCTEVESAAYELTATSQTVSGHAAEAAKVTDSISEQSQTVQVTLAESVTAIGQLANDIDGSSVVIKELEKNVAGISSILEVIRGIADQTNLLALNAAIEAARAGEQGRGFAVVADEVRSLANKTQSCTSEIHSMIEKLQDTVGQSVEAMRNNSEAGTTTVEQAQQTNIALDAMSESIVMISDVNRQVAIAADQQTVVTGNLSDNIRSIVMACEETLSNIQSAQQTCDGLASQSETLDGLVSQFKV
ncbi:methyl-accepting chemotaxis protein [Photobacterium gaetbulicola]|uniref:Putative methyl-accepting chemotaxisprotein n=1 Tax=Photobacterium gaetbulicola Gung47 TaxID=658445 RepID=A0A0C5WPE9_9GAMM|nr:methyl-accepting chemotaxis protein [Photobacterium gaetbulicola]AJR08212.1 putative methyl-accepting chemotaxisprotein [Photobacterium gaetbulicola Gung47]PSU13088.1 methyl-accepting chemotaxis protein [Photobacterium gaetbulicola]